jgi:hypothetical protein
LTAGAAGTDNIVIAGTGDLGIDAANDAGNFILFENGQLGQCNAGGVTADHAGDVTFGKSAFQYQRRLGSITGSVHHDQLKLAAAKHTACCVDMIHR